jgi:STE24 endopeptidase
MFIHYFESFQAYPLFIGRLLQHHQSCYYNAPFLLIVSIIMFNFILERWLDFINTKEWSDRLPEEVKDVYDAGQYKKSQLYKHVNDKFGLLTSTFSFLVVLTMLFFHVFGFIDAWARTVTSNPVLIAILFFGVFMIASDIVNTPFAIYDTFVIEERFGFNKTTIKTFILDKIKGWILLAILGGGVLMFIIWLYNKSEQYFWIYAWVALTAFSIFMTIFYSTLIVPLFNKQTPLKDGELRDAISNFCKKAGFRLQNVFVIDGSKRSTKANAYFTGLGTRKRIVLYDTLIKDLTTEEIVAVLAHEIGHYKKRHTIYGIVFGVIQTGIMLYVFSLFTVNPMLSSALGAKVKGVHMALMAFGVIYSPFSTLVGVFMNQVSRKQEYEADKFASDFGCGEPLISGLKKLSSNNLSNLTPHPAYVFFHYSHPTLIQRIRAIKKL